VVGHTLPIPHPYFAPPATPTLLLLLFLDNSAFAPR